MASDVLITPSSGLIQFSSSAGSGSGAIQADGDNLVISNELGDVLLGDGASDVFIGDGTNNVDIIFEQNGEIQDDGSGKSITLGSKTTNIFITGSSTIALQKDGGNVGIGTTSANTLLDIKGDISASGDIQISSSVINTAGISGSGTISGFTSASIASGSFDGISIGNASPPPGQELVVEGNISSSGTVNAVSMSGDGSGLTGVTSTAAVSGDTFATDLKIGRDSTDLIDFASFDNVIVFRVGNNDEMKLTTTNLNPGSSDGLALGAANRHWSDLFLADAAVINFNNGEINLTQTDAALVMSGSGTTTLEVLGNISGSLTSTGSFGAGFFDNKVGIGTTDPNNPLSVSGSLTVFTANQTSRLTVGEGDDSGESTNNCMIIETTGASNKSRIFTKGTSNDFVIETMGNNSDIHLSSDRDIRFGTNNNTAYNFSEKMIMSSSGNFGIGTSTPGEKLEVAGNISASGVLDIGGVSGSGDISGFTSASIASGSFDGISIGNASPPLAYPLVVEGNVSASGDIITPLTGSFGGIKLNDAKRIQLGTGNDLQIFHDGSNSNISDSGTGALNINGSVVRIREVSDGNTLAEFTDGAGTLLKHNNSTKFETSATGITVTGDIDISSSAINTAGISASGKISLGDGGGSSARFHIDIDAEDNQPAFRIDKVSDQDETAFIVNHNTSATNRGIADFQNSVGSILFIRGDGLISGSLVSKFVLGGDIDISGSVITPAGISGSGTVSGFTSASIASGSFDGISIGNASPPPGQELVVEGNISSSGTIIAEHLETTDDLTVADDINLGDLSLISFGGAGRGTITGSALNLKVGASDLVIQTGSTNTAFRVDTSAGGNIGIEGAANLIINNNITASVNSKFQWGEDGGNRVEIQDGNITASANISASGDSHTFGGTTTLDTTLTTTNKFEKTGNTDAEGQGDVVFLGGTTSMDAGKIYHYKSDGTWELADADAVANCDGLLAVALGAASDTNGMLLRGTVTLDHDPGAVGDVLFLATGGTGQATATAPSGNTDIVRVIGYCLDASNGQIWFNPDNTFVEVSA